MKKSTGMFGNRGGRKRAAPHDSGLPSSGVDILPGSPRIRYRFEHRVKGYPFLLGELCNDDVEAVQTLT